MADTKTETPTAAQMVSSLQAELAGLRAELDKTKRGAHTLGKVVVSQGRDLYAAWIEVSRGDLHAAREWILNSVPDVWDDEPWNGTETAREWFERTSASTASPPGEETPHG